MGADEINSAMRECLVGHPDKPRLTGDLAYWLLLNTKDTITDSELREFVTDPQLNYLVGPNAHATIFPFPSLNHRC